ncbi:MAG: hypothetical protein HFH85_04220 [Lachnospiraceae bacterium]|jgi:hypothetical protein|nr:hypothetical protein [Lachnospiraceae bacterium]
MFYQSQRMKLRCVRIVKKSRTNDIVICEDLNTAARNLYTLLVIKEHQTVKTYLEVFEQAGLAAQDSYIDSFSDQGAFCMVFPWQQERPLKDFYMGESYTLTECENVCISVIMACITSNLPYPVLYLILEQGQLHLAKDRTVCLGYQIDLAELDPAKSERDCAVQCASILRDLLRPKSSQKAFSYRLLEKKIARKSYRKLTELYKDIRITAAPGQKKGIRKRIVGWFLRNQDGLFRFLLYLCSVLAILVLVSLLSQLILGDIPWLRLFINGFKTIGTETLVR